MNSAICVNRLAENLGHMRTPDFLRNCLGVRVSRTHLLATGQHIDLSTLAEQAGYRIHVFFRREAFDRLTQAPSYLSSESNGLYDALLSMREAMMKAPLRDCPVFFQAGDVALVAYLNRVDHDDPRPAATVAVAESKED